MLAGRLENNIIIRSERGIQATSGSTTSFSNNIVCCCAEVGVAACDNSRVELSETTFFKNRVNLWACTEAQPVVDRCLFQSPEEMQMYFGSGATGMITHCVVEPYSESVEVSSLQRNVEDASTQAASVGPTLHKSLSSLSSGSGVSMLWECNVVGSACPQIELMRDESYEPITNDASLVTATSAVSGGHSPTSPNQPSPKKSLPRKRSKLASIHAADAAEKLENIQRRRKTTIVALVPRGSKPISPVLSGEPRSPTAATQLQNSMIYSKDAIRTSIHRRSSGTDEDPAAAAVKERLTQLLAAVQKISAANNSGVSFSRCCNGLVMETDANPTFEGCVFRGHHTDSQLLRIRQGEHLQAKERLRVENSPPPDTSPMSVPLAVLVRHASNGVMPRRISLVSRSKSPPVLPPPTEFPSEGHKRSARTFADLLHSGPWIGSGGNLPYPPAARLILDDDVPLCPDAYVPLSSPLLLSVAETPVPPSDALGAFGRHPFYVPGVAVIVSNKGRGTLRRCDVCGNQDGAHVMNGGNPRFDNCLFTRNLGSGVVVCSGGRGVVIKSVLTQNKQYQILATGTGTDPLVEDNDVSNGGLAGMSIDLGARGTYLRNRIFNFVSYGLVVAEQASPTVENNDIYDCETSIYTRSGACGTYLKNRVYGTRSDGIRIEGPGTAPRFSGNFVSQAGGNGALIISEASPAIERDEYFMNGGYGIHASQKSAPCITSCKIYDNVDGGISCSHISMGKYERNVITGNQGPGFSSSISSQPQVVSNLIYDGDGAGVVVEHSGGDFAMNRIVSNAGNGVVITSASDCPRVRLNDIEGGRKAGVLVEQDSKAQILRNLIANNFMGGIVVESSAAPEVQENWIRQNGSFGISCGGQSAPVILQNVITRTVTGSCIDVFTGACPSVSRNLVGFSQFGIHVYEGGKGLFTDNLVVSGDEANICLEQKCSPSINNNVIVDGGAVGILVRNGGSGTVCGAHIFGALQVGIRVVDITSKPLFEGCLIHDVRPGHGILDEGSSTYRSSVVLGCATGVEFRAPSASSMEQTEIKECGVGALLTGGSATMDGCSIAANSKAGVQSLPGSTCTVASSKLFHGKTAMTLEGGGEVRNCEIYWNTDGIVVTGGNCLVNSNTIYDATNTGLTIKDGQPTVKANFIFDCTHCSFLVEKGTPIIDDNRVFFARDDGAFIVEPAAQPNVVKNLVRNLVSPPWDPNPTDRQLLYHSIEKQHERLSATFKKHMHNAETILCGVLDALRSTLTDIDLISPYGFLICALNADFAFEGRFGQPQLSRWEAPPNKETRHPSISIDVDGGTPPKAAHGAFKDTLTDTVDETKAHVTPAENINNSGSGGNNNSNGNVVSAETSVERVSFLRNSFAQAAASSLFEVTTPQKTDIHPPTQFPALRRSRGYSMFAPPGEPVRVEGEIHEEAELEKAAVAARSQDLMRMLGASPEEEGSPTENDATRKAKRRNRKIPFILPPSSTAAAVEKEKHTFAAAAIAVTLTVPPRRSPAPSPTPRLTANSRASVRIVSPAEAAISPLQPPTNSRTPNDVLTPVHQHLLQLIIQTSFHEKAPTNPAASTTGDSILLELSPPGSTSFIEGAKKRQSVAADSKRLLTPNRPTDPKSGSSSRRQTIKAQRSPSNASAKRSSK